MKGGKYSLNIKHIRESLANIFAETSIFNFISFQRHFRAQGFAFCSVSVSLSQLSGDVGSQGSGVVRIKCRPGQTCAPLLRHSLWTCWPTSKFLEDSSLHKLLINYIIQFSPYTLWF